MCANLFHTLLCLKASVLFALYIETVPFKLMGISSKLKVSSVCISHWVAIWIPSSLSALEFMYMWPRGCAVAYSLNGFTFSNKTDGSVAGWSQGETSPFPGSNAIKNNDNLLCYSTQKCTHKHVSRQILVSRAYSLNKQRRVRAHTSQKIDVMFWQASCGLHNFCSFIP